MIGILYPIHPEYVEQIFDGTKRAEYRTRLPKRIREAGTIIVIYETAPASKIVGYFERGMVKDEAPAPYRFSIGINSVFRLTEPMSLSVLGITSAPQGFRYLDRRQMGIVADMQKKVLTCSWGGCHLDEEEIEDPRLDPDDGVMCDRCYEEHFQFKCCRCLNYEENEHQHDYLVVYEKVGGVEPGVYKTLGPYWTSDYFNVWLDSFALERVRDLEEGAEGNGYPCGHLCMECRDVLLSGHKALIEQGGEV